MSDTQHTPTPWEADELRIWSAAGSDPIYIASLKFAADNDCPVQAEVNGEFIVRACNSHDELVAALTDCIESLINAGRQHVHSVERARAILAKVEATP